MKDILKNIWIGLLIFALGYLIVSYCTVNIYSGTNAANYQFYYAVVFSILYLTGTVGVCTALIIKEIKKLINSK